MKTIKILALMAIALPMAFISCSDDDDDAPSSPSDDGSVITTNDGDHLLVKSISRGSGTYNSLSLSYDSQGRCTSANCWGDWTLYISYDPYKIEVDCDAYEDVSLEFSFNSSGYISKVNWKYYEEDYEFDESYNGSESYSYSYDSDGHLTKVSVSYSGSGMEDGYKYSGSGNADMTVTWKSGDITQVVLSGKEKEGGETYEFKETHKYEYSSTQNEYQQYVLAIVGDAYEWMTEWADLAFIGYFGKGTAHLPTSYESEDEDGYTYSCTSSYTKNNDGTIKTEKLNSVTYNYTYMSLDSDTRSVASTFEDAFATPWNGNNVEHKRVFGLYRHLHSKHRMTE